MSTQLIKYEAACRALAECKSVDEVKTWADKAAAMQAYGRMAKDKTLEVDAAEIRIRAERRLGEMLADSDLQKGGRPPEKTGRVERPVSKQPTLADAGISKDLSSRAHKLAAVPAGKAPSLVVTATGLPSIAGVRAARLLAFSSSRASSSRRARTFSGRFW